MTSARAATATERAHKSRRNAPIATQPNGFDVGAELELGDTFVLIVVPNHHFVRRILGIRAAADERQYVAPKEHFNNPDAASALPLCASPTLSAQRTLRTTGAVTRHNERPLRAVRRVAPIERNSPNRCAQHVARGKHNDSNTRTSSKALFDRI